MIVVVSGTRRPLSEEGRAAVSSTIVPFRDGGLVKEWRVGDCPTGVDCFARVQLGLSPLFEYEADWDFRGRSAGPVRNAELLMQPSLADLLLAFPVKGSTGTKDCIARALRLGVDVVVVWLDEADFGGGGRLDGTRCGS